MKTILHPLRCWWDKFKLWMRWSAGHSPTARLKSAPANVRRRRRTTCFFEMP